MGGPLGRGGHRGKGLTKEVQRVGREAVFFGVWSKEANVDSEFKISKAGEVSRDGSFVLTKVIKGEKSAS